MHNHCDIAGWIIYKADYIMYMINIPIYNNAYQNLAGFAYLTHHDPNVKQQFSTNFLKSPWIVPQFLNLRPKMAKYIVYVITLITNRNHAFHCLN